MRTVTRLNRLAQWVYETICEGRVMKTAAPNMDFTKIVRQEPKVYLAYYPLRPDETGFTGYDPVNTAPSVLIMPAPSYAKSNEEKRFDRYGGVHRNPAMGQQLTVQILFSVYEDGLRLPGFIDKVEAGEGYDFTLVREGSYDGFMTLYHWMDDLVEALLGAKIIPGTDLMVDEESIVYAPYSDQKFVADKRPVFYGYVNVTFSCHANENQPLNKQTNDLLR